LGVIEEVVNNRMLIVTGCEGNFEEVRLGQSLEIDVDFKRRDETPLFGFLSGQVVTLGDLCDGKVSY
jgi:hypothetical protein